MAQVQCDSSPMECDEEDFVTLEQVERNYVARLNEDTPTVRRYTHRILQSSKILLLWQSALTMIYIYFLHGRAVFSAEFSW